MSKGAGRKPSEKASSAQTSSAGVESISPDEAERAAASFVPLWQFDEAPFEAGGKVSDSDLSALAAPVAAVIVVPPAPPTGIAAPQAGLEPEPPAPVAAAPVLEPVPPPPALVVVPPPPPDLGPAESVILAPDVAPAPPPSERPAARRTDPPSRPPTKTVPSVPRSERLPAARAKAISEDVVYPATKSRVPLVIIGAVGSAAIVFGIYFVSNAMSAPSQPPVAVTATPRPTQTTVNIPPPPPPDETPPIPIVTKAPPPPPTVAAIPTMAATSLPPAPLPPAPRVGGGLPGAPARPPGVPHAPRPPATKNSSPAAHPGDIVRDNPF